MKKLSPGTRVNSSGQALLLVLLSMAIVLTVALSIAARSVVDITTSTYEEDAFRAFSAAEAGVEQTLLTNTASGGTVKIDPSSDPSLTYSTTITSPSMGGKFEYPVPLLSGETATVWFVSHDVNGNLTCGVGTTCTRAAQLEICWGTPTDLPYDSTTPAIEVALYYDDSLQAIASPNNFQNVLVKKYTADETAVARGNNFDDGVTTDNCFQTDGYEFRYENINMAGDLPPTCAVAAGMRGCLLMAKIRMYYNETEPHPLRVRLYGGGTEGLPAQGIQIESTGEAGESTRKVRVFRGFLEPPPIFDFAIFSRNNLTK